jgi:hypothetical protein
MFRSMWAFVDAPRFFALYSPDALDRLERERGLHVAHTYLETLHKKTTRFGRRNLLVDGEAVTLDPNFAHLLDDLAARQKRKSLWIPTLSQLGDRLRQVAELRLTVDGQGRFLAHAPAPIASAGFVVPREDVQILVGGKPPSGLTRAEGETSFFADLPAGDTPIEIR